MKKIEPICENKNFSAVNIGSFDDLMEYRLIHPKLKTELEGKVFLKNATQSTGTEISFNMLPPQTEQPYFHIHNKNEETYIIIKGSGYFQVDDACFEISEGSVIRVAPKGLRGIRNASTTPMVYMVIQSKEGSLEEYTSDDGSRLPNTAKWPK